MTASQAVVAQAFEPSTQEAEAKGSMWVQAQTDLQSDPGQPGLHREIMTQKPNQNRTNQTKPKQTKTKQNRKNKKIPDRKKNRQARWLTHQEANIEKSLYKFKVIMTT